VTQERLRHEVAGSVDEEGGVGVLVGQLPADAVHLLAVGEIGGDAVGRAVSPRVWTVSSTFAGSWPMITALPPAATMSVAVWRPTPLLPPTTTSFCPSKTGLSVSSSQFVLT
jgi:hypothetical protein